MSSSGYDKSHIVVGHIERNIRCVITPDDSQIYRDLMRLRPEGLSPNAWAVKAGVSRTVWTDMRRHGNPSRRTLEKLLSAAGSSLLEFEALRVGPAQSADANPAGRFGDHRAIWNPRTLAPLPLIASSLGGEWGDPGSKVELTEIRRGELLDRVHRPPSLSRDPEAFAMTIVGRGMWPRFRTGARIAVSPRSPVGIGDDVLVRLRSPANAAGERTLIMQLVNRTATTFELRQFSPDKTIEVATANIESISKIVGELI